MLVIVGEVDMAPTPPNGRQSLPFTRRIEDRLATIQPRANGVDGRKAPERPTR